MVERESIELDLKTLCRLITGAVANRGANGEWSIVVTFAGEIEIDETRALPLQRDVAMKTRQLGRRTNPAQNWGKGGGFKKKDK